MTDRTLPWAAGERPLMLAPLQGLTNRAVRTLFIDWVHPDVVFTEFMRVTGSSAKRLRRSDLHEAASESGDVPLVAQLVGHHPDALGEAAQAAQAAGARHINLNLGCPYGRMTTGATGGKLLRQPEQLAAILPPLRAAVTGTLSIKLRAGYDDPQQCLGLVELFEDAGIDFLILHPRTVRQEYTGHADHAITAEMVKRTSLPVIANGDIRTAADGWRVLEQTKAAGLMLGRGAMGDPLLFERLRGKAEAEPSRAAQVAMLRRYLRELLDRYNELFCGPTQVLNKAKAVIGYIDETEFAVERRQMLQAKSLPALQALIETLA